MLRWSARRTAAVSSRALENEDNSRNEAEECQ